MFWRVSNAASFTRGETVVLGVSGGVDSTALALLVSPLRHDLELTLHIAHFDHRLRSRREAALDRACVEALGKKLAIHCHFGEGDVRARAKEKGESIEEAARNLRYEFLGRVARTAGATAVGVGHTANDQVETVLQRIIRGTGLEGLAGIRPRRPWPFGEGPDIVRPVLALTREETVWYCKSFRVRPREDPTNRQLIASRNRIRHQLLPALRRLNPKVDESLLRLATIAADQLILLDSITRRVWSETVERESQKEIAFSRPALTALDRAVSARLVQVAVNRLGAEQGQVTSQQITAILEQLTPAAKSRWRSDLPGGLAVSMTKQRVTIRRGAHENAGRIPEGPLAVPGRTRAGSWSIEAAQVERDAVRPRDSFAALLDLDAIDGPLSVRSRKPGDRMRPLGLGGSKKLQDILVDAKVPSEGRDSVPVVADRLGIVWVVGHCIDERVAVSAKTRRVARLRVRRKRSP